MAVPEGENKRSPLKAWMRALERTAAIERGRASALPLEIGALAARLGSAPALSSQDGTLSYQALAAQVTRYARWGLKEGLARGDVAALFMENGPEYLAVWLGLTRIGVTVALVNTHLTHAALVHSLNTVRPRLMVCDTRLAAQLLAVRAQLTAGVPCWVHGPGIPDLPRLDEALATLTAEPLSEAECPAPDLRERALCIYTSGTTGLPKAANVSHYRLLQWSHWFAGLMDITPSDRMYDCLPLYHSVGGVVATCATLVGGGSVVLRRRFSASTFWADVVDERCTLFQYIGELCRYLLNAPPRPEEAQHRLRLACGNGLREDVWRAFQERFRIPQILEYYAATEGNFSLYNCEGRPGAVGRIPPFLAHRVPVALVKFDVAAGVPARDAAGRCVRCAVGESGEALGQILTSQAGTRFEGYTDAAATGGKILTDVFASGDAWYRTGDLMRQDAQGFFYFVDRVGDTFRWKGENVSTGEVTAVLTACPGVEDAAVYGVPVANADGRAGMAALVVSADFELAALHRLVGERLPAYARPLFVRLVPAIELTGTFKLRKQELAAQGYDPARVRGALYLDDSQSGAYVTLDAALYARLAAGQLRL
jgi:fatty-acyl-CoA synthase